MLRCGYSATRVADVCADAGVERAAFHREFGPKVGLGVAVVERFAAQREDILGRAFRDGLPIRGQVQRLFGLLRAEQESWRTRIGRAPGSPFAMIAGDVEDDPLIREALGAAFEASRWRARVALTVAVERGEIRLPDPDYAARALILYLEGALHHARAMDRTDVITEMAPASMSLLVDYRATGAWPVILAPDGR